MDARLGWFAKTQWPRGMPVSWVHDWRSPVESPFWSLIPSVTAKASPTQPSPFLWVVTRPAAPTLCGRKWISFNQTGSWSQVDRAGIPPVLPCLWRKAKKQNKTQENYFLSDCFPPPIPSTLAPISLSLWVKSCLFSCPSLTKYVNEQMDSGPLPCSLFYFHWLTDLH